MSEEAYDEQIAPMLLEIAKKSEELGMTFVASVEWETGETGSTAVGDFSKAGPAQFMTLCAARSNGNFDAVGLAMLKKYDCSASMFLERVNKK